VDFCVRRGVRRVAYPLWIWQRLTTTSLRKKTKQTLRLYCMVPAQTPYLTLPVTINCTTSIPATINMVPFRGSSRRECRIAPKGHQPSATGWIFQILNFQSFPTEPCPSNHWKAPTQAAPKPHPPDSPAPSAIHQSKRSSLGQPGRLPNSGDWLLAIGHFTFEISNLKSQISNSFFLLS